MCLRAWRFTSAMCALIVGASFTSDAAGEILEFTFQGLVTEVAGASIDPALADVKVGQSLSVRYLIDTETEDSSASSQVGRYATLLYEVTIGSAVFEIPLGQATVHNFSSSDSYFASAEVFEGEVLRRAEVVMFGNSNSIFSDDSLPTSLDLMDFDDRFFSYEELTELFAPLGGGGDPFDLRGTLDALTIQVVPAPGALSLFVLAVIVGGWRRSRGWVGVGSVTPRELIGS